MTRHFAAALVAVVGLSALAAAAQQTSGQSSEKYIEVDGSKTPDAIPWWHVWSTTFRLISSAREGQLPRIPGLSPAEIKDVVAVARTAVVSDLKCNREISGRIAEWAKLGRTPAETRLENETLILACRQGQLDHADRLVASLPESSRPALVAFANERRKGISAMVPENGMAFYRSPR